MGKSRKFIISWNNYPKELTLEKLKNKLCEKANVEYLILGYEKGLEKETPHIQGYVRFTNPQHFNSIHKLLENNDGTLGFLQEANGNDIQNKEYCSKQNNFIEYGKPSNYSKDEELNEKEQSLIEDILNDIPFIDIVKKHSHYVLYHYRDFKQIYDDLRKHIKEQKEIQFYNNIGKELINNGTGTMEQ